MLKKLKASLQVHVTDNSGTCNGETFEYNFEDFLKHLYIYENWKASLTFRQLRACLASKVFDMFWDSKQIK